ncbi:MAG: aliphatic sulfonate ABC transporter substrate-binding protein [Clostridiales Family XIII bacterium]|jgi:taurine transport system substrate-binding protein|nr:aliphatic sulfonate ABC transporter substrate-binding protein [Clostridiales Family XIII bacterium]
MKKLSVIILVIAMLVTFAGCSSSSKDNDANAKDSGDKSAAATPTEIRLGYWESPNEELLVKQTGALEEAFPDAEVTWIEFQSGPDILAAIQGGSIDFSTIGTPPGTIGIANGLPYKIFYLHDVIAESEGLIVKADSGIESVADVKGKRIATVFASTSHFSLSNALKLDGLTDADVQLYDMKAPDIFAAWERGDIDGAYVWEPIKTKLLDAGGKQIISSGEVAESGAITGEFGIVSDAFSEKYPDAVKTYIDILDEATDAYKNDQENTAKLIAPGLGITEEEALISMNEIIVLSKADQTDPTYLGTTAEPGNLAQLMKDTADFLVEQKSIKSAPSVEEFQKGILTQLYD